MTSEVEPGVGCRTLSVITGILVAFAAAAAAVGIAFVDDPACTGFCERVGFTAYGAGLPVSALFTVLTANDLVVAFFSDLILWIVVAVGLTRLIEHRRLTVWKPAIGAIGAAVVYGIVVGLLLARA